MERSGTSTRDTVRALLIGVLVGFVILAGISIAWRSRPQESITLVVQPVDDATQIRVFVNGAVEHPGIYSLPRGSRLADAIERAGGASKQADLTGLGMASVVHDSDLITVPARVPTSTPGTSGSGAVVTRLPGSSAGSTGPAARLNVNQATAEELVALPEIGQTIAQRIIDYRTQNGPFQTVDELVAVKGISERIVQILRPLVTVGP